MKKLLPLSCALASLVLLAEPAPAAVDRSKKPEPGPAPAASFPDYTERSLPNGLKVFVIEDDRKPMVTLRLLIKSGTAADGQKTGSASFVANLLNRGTATRTAEQFAQATDSLGVKVEAAAGPDSISAIASGLKKYTSQVLDLFAEAVLTPTFPAEQFAKAQRQTLSALAAEKQEPDSLANKLTGKIVYGDHPYGAYRTPETVKAIQREDLVAFHKAHFVPGNATLAVVGDVKAAEIMPLVEKAFAKWGGELPKKIEYPEIPRQTGVKIHLVDRPGSVQSNVIVTKPGPARSNPSLPELNVLNATLGGGFSGRLFQNLRERHGWTYGSSSAFDLRKLGGSFEATAETRNEVTADAIGEMLKEMKRIGEEPIPEPELELQRQYNVGNYLLSLESTSRTAQRVQDIDLYGLAPDFYKHYAKRMAVTSAEEAAKLARQYLDPADTAIIVVGEAKDVQPALEKIGKVQVYDMDLKPVPAAKN